MASIYRLGVWLYRALIQVAALLGVSKARLWVQGRQIQRLPSYAAQERVVWMHCASLGEFEQGRPVLEALRREDPTVQVVLTFFSPSGYEVRKHYAGADWVGYLPADLGDNARRFVEAIRPRLAIFVKYDLWLGYLQAIRAHGGTSVLIASHFHQKRGALRVWQRNVLGQLDAIFTLGDEHALALQRLLPNHKIQTAGDPRFDRVAALATQAQEVPEIAAWLEGAPCLVAGSSWPPDARLLQKVWKGTSPKWRLLLVPHEVSPKSVAAQTRYFPEAHLLSQGPPPATARVVVVDSMGLLGRLYRYATVAYVGGGFGRGIHNTLEAAVWGRPVLFGPKHQRFREALGLIAAGAAASVQAPADMLRWLAAAETDSDVYRNACGAAEQFARSHTGATEIILDRLKTLGWWPLL